MAKNNQAARTDAVRALQQQMAGRPANQPQRTNADLLSQLDPSRDKLGLLAANGMAGGAPGGAPGGVPGGAPAPAAIQMPKGINAQPGGFHTQAMPITANQGGGAPASVMRQQAAMASMPAGGGSPGGAPRPAMATGAAPTPRPQPAQAAPQPPTPQPLTSNPQMQQMLEARQNRMDQVQANRQPFSPQNMAQRFPQLQHLVDRAQAVRERLGQQPWSPQALMGNNPGIQQAYDRQQQAQQGLDRTRQQRGGAAGVWLPR